MKLGPFGINVGEFRLGPAKKKANIIVPSEALQSPSRFIVHALLGCHFFRTRAVGFVSMQGLRLGHTMPRLMGLRF